MTTVQHATFSLERTYPAPPARVFAAWSDPATKARWFVGPDGGPNADLASDFRVGGRETASGKVGEEGTLYTYEAEYRDIVPDERIVTTYEMAVDARRISVSVATVELAPADGGTRLVYTEQGAYLDGLDQPQWREQGTADHLDRLGDVLAADAAEEGSP